MAIIAKELARIQPNDKLVEELGLDSIDAANIAVNLEDMFNIKVDVSKITECVTVADIINYVDRQIQMTN